MTRPADIAHALSFMQGRLEALEWIQDHHPNRAVVEEAIRDARLQIGALTTGE